MTLNLLKWFMDYKIESTPRSSNQVLDTMVSLGSLITPNPHQHIQHVEIMILKEPILKIPLPQGLQSTSINDIIHKPHNLLYKQLHEYLKWNATNPSLIASDKCTFK